MIRTLMALAGMLLVCGCWFPVFVVTGPLPAFAAVCGCMAAGMAAVVYGTGSSR